MLLASPPKGNARRSVKSPRIIQAPMQADSLFRAAINSGSLDQVVQLLDRISPLCLDKALHYVLWAPRSPGSEKILELLLAAGVNPAKPIFAEVNTFGAAPPSTNRELVEWLEARYSVS